MPSIFKEKPEPLELRARAGTYWWISAWLPPLIAVLIVMRESTPLFSGANTSSFLRPIFESIFGPINEHVWQTGHMLFRKSVHFIGYGSACLTFLRAWLLTLAREADLRRSTWRLRSVGLAIVCTFLLASADEYHQTFLPSRTGLFSDVMIDTCGASLACALVWFFLWRRGRRRRH